MEREQCRLCDRFAWIGGDTRYERGGGSNRDNDIYVVRDESVWTEYGDGYRQRSLAKQTSAAKATFFSAAFGTTEVVPLPFSRDLFFGRRTLLCPFFIVPLLSRPFLLRAVSSSRRLLSRRFRFRSLFRLILFSFTREFDHRNRKQIPHRLSPVRNDNRQLLGCEVDVAEDEQYCQNPDDWAYLPELPCRNFY